jgi:hypothetical protein
MEDTLQSLKDTIQSFHGDGLNGIGNSNPGDFNIWMVIAILELLVILVLFIRIKKIQNEQLINRDGFFELKNAKSQNIDMENLMNDINLSKDLYKVLSRSCHPDRFHDDLVKAKAEILFQEITKHKRSYTKLLELKKRANKELNLNLK